MDDPDEGRCDRCGYLNHWCICEPIPGQEALDL